MPAMEKDKYNKNFATALVASSGGIGMVIPPSIPFVIFAILTGQFVGTMFMAEIIPGLLMGIYSGIFTATEAAGVSVVYSLFVGIFIYKTIDRTAFKNLFLLSAVSSGLIMFIMGSAGLFTWILTTSGAAGFWIASNEKPIMWKEKDYIVAVTEHSGLGGHWGEVANIILIGEPEKL